MSANQIPHFGPRPEEFPGRARPHSCPVCWMNGGEGHVPAAKRLIGAADSMVPSSLRRTLPAWAESAMAASK